MKLEKEILNSIKDAWDESKTENRVGYKHPNVYLALYQNKFFLVIDDSRTVFKLGRRNPKYDVLYYAVKSKCIKSTTVNGTEIYKITEKDAVQYGSTKNKTTNKIDKFVLDVVVPEYLKYENSGSSITSIITSSIKPKLGEDDEEEDEDISKVKSRTPKVKIVLKSKITRVPRIVNKSPPRKTNIVRINPKKVLSDDESSDGSVESDLSIDSGISEDEFSDDF